MNNLNLIGNLGGDPEIRYMESGLCIAKFSLAFNRLEKGEKTTDWFDVTAFGKTAETIANYVKKGSQIGITGSLRQEKWVDRESGGNRSKVVVICERLTLLGGKQQSESSEEEVSADPGFDVSNEPVKAKSKPKAAAATSKSPSPGADYSDVPF